MTILFRSLYLIVFILAISTVYKHNNQAVELNPIELNDSTPRTLPENMYYKSTKVNLSEREYNCLVNNVYHEARGEPMTGMIAVAQITINRLESGKWGNDLCKVVYAKHQFSWTSRKKLPAPIGDALEDVKLAVKQVLYGTRINKLHDSLFYHATWIDRPDWTFSMKEKKTIGQHVFYAMK